MQNRVCLTFILLPIPRLPVVWKEEYSMFVSFFHSLRLKYIPSIAVLYILASLPLSLPTSKHEADRFAAAQIRVPLPLPPSSLAQRGILCVGADGAHGQQSAALLREACLAGAAPVC